MVNLGILTGTITDNNAVILDEDAVGSNAPYLYGSLFNNSSTSVIVNVQVNTPNGLKKAPVPLNGSQVVELKGLRLHSIQCGNASPNLNYIFSVVEIEGELVGETRY